MTSKSAVLGAALALLAVGAAPAVAAGPPAVPNGPGPIVVLDNLNNPRQLNWQGTAGNRLVVAEAGNGGTSCSDQGCIGNTGAVGTVDNPAGVTDGTPIRRLTGLFSGAGPDGSFASGSSGADMVGTTGPFPRAALMAVIGSAPDLPKLPGTEQAGKLVGEATGKPVKLLANLSAYEAKKNPDLKQVESNPYSVLVQEKYGRILVADAAGNDVLSIDRNFAIKPFAIYTPTAGRPEFVPTSLAEDADGNVYVGGLGSEQKGKAQVVKYSPTGKFLERWLGFTAVTGIAVGPDGDLYVSQLFGNDPEAAQQPGATPGNVIRLHEGARTSYDVPFPAGLAVDAANNVFVSANSVFDADGPAGGGPRGQVWKIRF